MKIEQFIELKQKGLNMDLIWMLQKIHEGKETILIDGIISSLLLTLERKGYILEGLVTQEGVELLDSLKEKKIKTKKFPKIDDVFEKWWKAYPGTNEFTYRGKAFLGTRALRTKKEKCREKFEEIVDEGVNAEDMVKALEKEIEQKKEESYKKNDNKLTYMQNTLTYLNQRTFEPYIELIKETKQISVKSNITDI